VGTDVRRYFGDISTPPHKVAVLILQGEFINAGAECKLRPKDSSTE